MYAVKVNGLINDRDLIIPFDKVKQLNHKSVEIIILPSNKDSKRTTHGKLAQIFAKYKGVHPYSDIMDAGRWQKDIRNEWK